MLNEHLDLEKLNLLSNGKLTGKPLAKALLHLDECEICRAQVAVPEATQIFNAIFVETQSIPKSGLAGTAKNTNFRIQTPLFTGKTRSLSFGLSAACAVILAVIAGTMWWSYSPPENAKVVEMKTPISISSPTNSEDQKAVGVTPQIKEEITLTEPQPAVSPTEPDLSNNSKTILVKKALRNADPNRAPVKAATNNTEANENLTRLAKNTARPLTNFEPLNQFLTKLPPVLANLRSSAINLRSGNPKNDQPIGEAGESQNDFRLLTPQGEVIRETQPDFKWQPVENAKRYRISVFSRDDKEVITDLTQSNNYQLKNPLKRGETYLWQVTVQTDQGEPIHQRPPARPAFFRVASKKTIARLQRLKTGRSSWEMISALLEEGLLGEAETELKKILHRSEPNEPAQKLLNRVQTLRSGQTN